VVPSVAGPDSRSLRFRRIMTSLSESLRGAWMHRRVTVLLALLGLAPALHPIASANANINAGTLNCHVGAGWGLVVGSARPVACTFTSFYGPPERYAGTMWKVGLDLGYTQGGALIWTVIASTNPTPGALAGNYVGGTASATVGVGVGANGLIGGSFDSIMLQPLSVETNQGFNVSGGIGWLALGRAETPPSVSR
jgi:hypothetical protein